MHLDIAEQVRVNPGIDSHVRRTLEDHWSAFYLGNVAPDFQSVCQISRQATHFYDIPQSGDVAEAYQQMWQQYPALASPTGMPLDQAVFVAGYCAHLLLDLCWYWHILWPKFLNTDSWPTDRRQRFLIHNILLTYLDKLAFDALPAPAGQILAAAQPTIWLPFADDQYLIRWRDLLTPQLQPGANLETIAIYAGRLRMLPADFANHLTDPGWMMAEVFNKISLDYVQTVLADSVDQTVTFLNQYLSPCQAIVDPKNL